MDIYLAPILLSICAWIVQIRRNRKLDLAVLAAVAVTIILISGLRWYADIDYREYREMYDDNPLLRDFSPDAIASLYGEPGYLFVTAIFKSLDTGFAGLVLACAIVAIGLKAIVVSRLSSHASLALCLYLCLHFVTIEFIQMRWAVATGWIALGFLFQYRRSYFVAVLSFAIAIAFHYFSIVFCLVALMVPLVSGGKLVYLLSAMGAAAAALFLTNQQLAPLLVTDSNLYILGRLARYVDGSEVPLIGLFSYVKLLMYAVAYVACVRYRPSYPWNSDRLNVFLLSVSMLSIFLTVSLSSIPTLHYRATVVADLFSIMLILNALHQALDRQVRTVALAVVLVLFCSWYALDVRNYVKAGRLYEYQSWLTAL